MDTNHYALTKKQFTILNLLYRFRFITSDLLALATQTHQSSANKRLQLLLEQNYIGRHFEPTYHIQRKPAVYYLRSAGIKALKQSSATKYRLEVLKNLANDARASEQFRAHNLNVFGVYCSLKSAYADQLQFFTKSQLSGFDYFPAKLPDAYIQLGEGENQHQFFLDVLHENQPFFVATRRVVYYVSYADSGDWGSTGTKLPRVLLICDSASLENRLVRKMRAVVADLDDNEETLQFYTSTLTRIGEAGAWRPMVDHE